MSRDWIRFHDLYETLPPLQARLKLVQAQIERAIEEAPSGPVRVLSLCAGDGRDLLGALIDHARAADVAAALIDSNAELVARGEAAQSELALPASLRFLHADATLADTYLTLAPADLVIAAGVFGNLKLASMQQLVHSLRCLCKKDSKVVWTHKTTGMNSEARVAMLCEMLQQSDFRELTFTRTEPDGFVVATYAYVGDPLPLLAGIQLFEFPV
jgi:hypothetical protein